MAPPAEVPAPCTLEVIDSPDGLDPRSWDEVSRDAYTSMTLPYLRYSESVGSKARYLIARRDDGRYTGAIRFENLTREADALDGPAGIITLGFRGESGARRARRLLSAWGGAGDHPDPVSEMRRLVADALYPTALVFAPFEAAVLTGAELDSADRESVVGDLLDGLADEARRSGCRSVLLMGVRSDLALDRAVKRRGFHGALLTMAASFDLRGARTLDEFTAARSRNVRRCFRRDREGFCASTFAVERVDPLAHLDRIVELEAAVLDKHRGPSDPPVDLVSFGRQKESEYRALGEAVRVFACLDGGEVLATNTCYFTGQRYIVSTFGVDPVRAHGVPVYHYLVYTVALRDALHEGCVELFAGFEAYEPKLLRGAALDGRMLYVLSLDAEIDPLVRSVTLAVDRASREYFQTHFGRFLMRPHQPPAIASMGSEGPSTDCTAC